MNEEIVKLIIIGAILVVGWIVRRVGERSRSGTGGGQPAEKREGWSQAAEQLREFFRQLEAQSRGETGEPVPPERPVPAPPEPTAYRPPAPVARPQARAAAPRPAALAAPTPIRRPSPEERKPVEMPWDREEPEEEYGEGEGPRLSIEDTIRRDINNHVGRGAESRAGELASEKAARWQARRAPTAHAAPPEAPAKVTSPHPSSAVAGAPSTVGLIPGTSYALGVADLRSAVILTEILGPPIGLRPHGENLLGLQIPGRK